MPASCNYGFVRALSEYPVAAILKMTSATKRKHVVQEMLDDFSIPEQHQQIVEVLGTPGSNLHEVLSSDRQKILCSLPVKFRKNIWIKRGDFVVIESIAEGSKVKAEIVRILYPQHVKFLRRAGQWPREFCMSSNEYIDENLPKQAEKMILKKKSASMLPVGDHSNRPENFGEGDMASDGDHCTPGDDDFSDVPANMNRPCVAHNCSTSESDSDESDDGS